MIRVPIVTDEHPVRHARKPALGEDLEADLAGPALEARIAAFLDGTTHGEDLLHVLYDHVLDEPVPERMRALLGK